MITLDQAKKLLVSEANKKRLYTYVRRSYRSEFAKHMYSPGFLYKNSDGQIDQLLVVLNQTNTTFTLIAFYNNESQRKVGVVPVLDIFKPQEVPFLNLVENTPPTTQTEKAEAELEKQKEEAEKLKQAATLSPEDLQKNLEKELNVKSKDNSEVPKNTIKKTIKKANSKTTKKTTPK